MIEKGIKPKRLTAYERSKLIILLSAFFALVLLVVIASTSMSLAICRSTSVTELLCTLMHGQAVSHSTVGNPYRSQFPISDLLGLIAA